MNGLYKKILAICYPKKLADILYYERLGKKINWKNPSTLNEKINWLAFCSNTSYWTILADKYHVRNYVKEQGFDDILPKLYGVYDSTDEINFDILPESFVIKCNHDCGSTMIVANKKDINIDKIKRNVNECMSRSFGINSAEPHYKRIPKKIIIEELIPAPIDSGVLLEYKFWAFNGSVKYCQVDYKADKMYNAIYKCPEWINMNEKLVNNSSLQIPLPQNLSFMIEIAEKLSTHIPQCRVDLYNSNGKIYFSELTFTSNCGRIDHYTNDFLYELGSYVDLNWKETPQIQLKQ